LESNTTRKIDLQNRFAFSCKSIDFPSWDAFYKFLQSRAYCFIYYALPATVKGHIGEDESRLRKNLYEVSSEAKPSDLRPERSEYANLFRETRYFTNFVAWRLELRYMALTLIHIRAELYIFMLYGLIKKPLIKNKRSQ